MNRSAPPGSAAGNALSRNVTRCLPSSSATDVGLLTGLRPEYHGGKVPVRISSRDEWGWGEVRTPVRKNKMEARVGFEPTSDGFADHSLRPLGYRALFVMPKIYQSYAQPALFLPIHAVGCLANPLIPHDAGLAEGFSRPLPWATWVPRRS